MSSNISLNFTFEEMSCPCCGKILIDPEFLERLELARELAGIPFPINSGFRCPEHNYKLWLEDIIHNPKIKETRNHPSGRAVDIKCAMGHERRLILNGLIGAEFNRIGIAKTFIHADTMDELGSPKSYWLY